MVMSQHIDGRYNNWSCGFNLKLNTLKTVEMVVDFRKNSFNSPFLTILNSPVSVVESFKFLGSIISQELKWMLNITTIIKKAQ